MTVKVIDVSSHNGVIDWKQVAAAGYVGAYIKATEGATWQDPNFKANEQRAHAAGMLWGPYCFARPKTSNAIQEADAFVDYVQACGGFDANGGFPPVLDLEDVGGLTSAQLNQFIPDWHNRIKQRTGRESCLYTNVDFYLTNKIQLPPGMRLWIAAYQKDRPSVKCDLWQYTETGSAPGIQGPVDISVFDGTLDEFKVLCGLVPTKEDHTVTTYAKVNAQINGVPIEAYDVNNDTYLHWTVLLILGIQFMHPAYATLIFGGKTVKGVVCNGKDTFINYKDVPGIKPTPLPDGQKGWNFVSDTTPAQGKKLLCIIKGEIRNDAFYFDWRNGPAHMVLDTGAFEPLVDTDIAQALGMPNLGPATVGGIGGTQQGYNSTLHVVFGTDEFDTPAVVAPYQGDGSGLFGLKAFEQQNLSIYLDIPNAQLYIYQ